MISQSGRPSWPSRPSAPEEAPECVEASPATGPALEGGGQLSGLSGARLRRSEVSPGGMGTSFVRAVSTSFLGTVEEEVCPEEAASSQALKAD